MTTHSPKAARIDPFSAVPKYRQMSDLLREKIERETWKPHQPIPPERELETLYNVSRTTVRQALDILVSEGFLYRKHGRGTFVAPLKLQHNLNHLTSFTNDMKIRGLSPGQRILHLGHVEAPGHIREQLALSEEVDEVLCIERIRLANAEPIGIHVAYLPLPREQSISEEELKNHGSLYALLESKFNLIYTEADETLEATTATEREAALLDLREGSPLLLIERTTFSQEKRPMEFVKMLYRADRYKYHVNIKR